MKMEKNSIYVPQKLEVNGRIKCGLRVLCCAFSSGVEHHLCQLADICLPHLVLHALDGAGPAALRHAVLALHGGLRQPADRAAVHLELREHGTRLRAVCGEEKSLPLAFIQGLEATVQNHAVRQSRWQKSRF